MAQEKVEFPITGKVTSVNVKEGAGFKRRLLARGGGGLGALLLKEP